MDDLIARIDRIVTALLEILERQNVRENGRTHESDRVREMFEHKMEQIESAARGDRFLRTCTFCYDRNPSIRVISTACGDIICEKCATGKNTCPLCEETTDFVRVFEGADGSREYANCLVEAAPFRRAVFASCGHLACLPCVSQIVLDSASGRCICPFCRSASTVVRAAEQFERPIEQPKKKDENDANRHQKRNQSIKYRNKNNHHRHNCLNQPRRR